MTIEEAKTMLKFAPRDEQRSAINRGLTRKQSTEIIERAINSPTPSMMMRDGVHLDLLFEKRVLQVTQDCVLPAGTETWMV